MAGDGTLQKLRFCRGGARKDTRSEAFTALELWALTAKVVFASYEVQRRRHFLLLDGLSYLAAFLHEFRMFHE